MRDAGYGLRLRWIISCATTTSSTLRVPATAFAEGGGEEEGMGAAMVAVNLIHLRASSQESFCKYEGLRCLAC